MSKSLSVATAIEKNRLSSDTPFLVLLDIDVIDPTTAAVIETLHVCKNSEDITFNSVLYTGTDFQIEMKSEAGTQSQIKLTIDDYTRAIQGRMQSYGGGIGFNVTVMVINGAALTSPPEVSEYFQVVGADANNYVVTFTLGAENALAVTFPRRKQTKDFCQWRYKDAATCKYAGALASCDLTLNGANGCLAHSNTINFGAYPGINANGVRYG